MPTASIKLPDGTSIVIEGSPEEIAKLLALYGGAAGDSVATTDTVEEVRVLKPKISRKDGVTLKETNSSNLPDLPMILEHIKNCEQAESIEINVLDKTGQVNRILLPLFIVHEHMDNEYGLTSGEISLITVDLGIPISTPNASNTLSGTASKYVIGDKVRKKGQAVHYKLSRRGVQYFKEILSGV